MLRFDPFGDALSRELMSQVSGRAPRFMPMDLYKVDDHYVLTTTLPGVDPGSVDVSVDNGTMTLTAHRTARSDEGVQWLSNERFSGTYRRQLSLGEGVDTSRISATYENGVLTVTHPARRACQAASHRGRPRWCAAHHRSRTPWNPRPSNPAPASSVPPARSVVSRPRRRNRQ